MSELSEVWRFLFTAVGKIFNFSLDVIFGVLFVASVIPPWRWYETCKHMSNHDYFSDWKGYCLMHLLTTIADVFVAGILLIAVTSPMRWRHILKCFLDNDHSIGENRIEFFALLPCAVYDWMAYLFGFIALLSPLGMQSMIIAVFFYPNEEFSSAVSTKVNDVMIGVGFYSIIDLFAHIFAVPLILLAPSTWPGLYQRFSDLATLKPTQRTYQEHNNWHEYYRTKRGIVINGTMHAFIDIITTPFLLLALISPWRNPLIREMIWPPSQTPPATTNTAAAATPRFHFYDLCEFNYRYKVELRKEIIYQGALAILDFFLLPMILPLFLTQYRYRQMKDELYGASTTNSDGSTTTVRKVWTHRELFLILQQFALLMTDIFLLALPLLILFVTQFRWQGIVTLFTKYDEKTLFFKKSSKLYSTTFYQFGLLLFDILLFPLIVLIFITRYRWKVLSFILANPKIHTSGFTMHYHILMNFFIILTDFVVYLPIFLIISLFALHRFIYSWLVIFEQRAESSSTKDDLIFNTEGESSAQPSNEGTVAQVIPPHLSLDYSYYSEGRLRRSLWKQIFQAILDIPILLMALVNIATLWRCYEMFYQIYKFIVRRNYAQRKVQIEAKSKPVDEVNQISVETSQSLSSLELLSFIIKEEDDGEIRGIISDQFLYLLRDFFCLLPFSLLLVTLYRAPALLMELIVKATERVLKDAPLWEVIYCAVEYKEGKDPIVTFRIKPNSKRQNEGGNLRGIEMKDYKLQILGKDIWDDASRLFGGFIVNLGKSFFTIKFKENESLIWNQATTADTNSIPSTSQSSAQTMKKVFPNAKDYQMIRQNSDGKNEEETSKQDEDLEFAHSPLARAIPDPDRFKDESSDEVETSEDTENQKRSKEERQIEVIMDGDSHKDDKSAESSSLESELRLVLPFKQIKPRTMVKIVGKFGSDIQFLFQVECKVKTPRSTWKENILLQYPCRLHDLIPIAQTGEGIFPVPDKERPVLVDQTRFVDQFHALVLQAFIELLLDMVHFFLFFFTLFNPWRFYQLVVSLLSKKDYLTRHLLQRVQIVVQQMHEHLYEYRSSIAPILNSMAKNQLSNGGRSALYWGNALFYRYYYRYNYYFYAALSTQEESILEEEKIDQLQRYNELGKSLNKTMRFLKTIYHPPSSDDPVTVEKTSLAGLEEKAEGLLKAHDDMMSVWFLKYGIWVYLNEDPITRKQKDLLSIVMTEKHDGIVRKMLRKKVEFDEYVNSKDTMINKLGVSDDPVKKKTSRKRPLFANNINETRSIIRNFANQTLSDLGSLLLLILLVLTMVRLFSLLNDYYKDVGKFSKKTGSNSASFTFHLKRQGRLLYEDSKEFLIFSLYFLLLCITVVSLPAFLSDILNRHNLSSMKKARECASRHAKEFFSKLCEFLLLFTAFKTYKIALKSSLYVALLPSAGIAEAIAITRNYCGVFFRFSLGTLIYAGLFIGSVLVILQARAKGDDIDGVRGDALRINFSLFIIVMVTVGLMFILAWLRRTHQKKLVAEHMRGNTSGGVSSTMQTIPFQWSLWNHLISFLVPMSDCIQLSAIILFFFWNVVIPNTDDANSTANTNDNSQSSSSYFLLNAENSNFGADNLSLMMYWSRQYGQFDSAISRITYNTNMSIATAFGIFYILLVTLPIAYGGESEETRRRWKIQQIRNQNFYHVLLILFTHFFSVWMMAMWMRPFSCLIATDSSSGNENLVLTSAFSVTCGGTDEWTSKFSLVLLTYYLITSFVFYIEDRPVDEPSNTQTALGRRLVGRNYGTYESSKNDLKVERHLVYYDITYNILTKGYYALMLMFCYVFFGVIPTYIILIIMFVFSLTMAIYPFFFPGFLSQSTHSRAISQSESIWSRLLDRMNSYCTVPSLLPLRCAAFLGISWTCLICFIRVTASNHMIFHKTAIFANEWVVYAGWILLFIISLFFSRRIEEANSTRWKEELEANGLIDVMKHLQSIYQNVLIDRSVIRTTIKKKPLSTESLLGIFNNNLFSCFSMTPRNALPVDESQGKPTKERKEEPILMNYLQYQLFHSVRNERDLIYLLLQLEENISVEQLSNDFYRQRSDWIQSLIKLANEPPTTVTANQTSSRENSRDIAPVTTAPRRGSGSNKRRTIPQRKGGEFSLAGDEAEIDDPVQSSGNNEAFDATTIPDDSHDVENPNTSSSRNIPKLPSLQQLLSHMTILQTALEETTATTTHSWQMLEIIFSFHLPRDCCYVIHSYLIDVKLVHQVLFRDIAVHFRPVPLISPVRNRGRDANNNHSSITTMLDTYSYETMSYKTKDYLQEMYHRIQDVFYKGVGDNTLDKKIIAMFREMDFF